MGWMSKIDDLSCHRLMLGEALWTTASIPSADGTDHWDTMSARQCVSLISPGMVPLAALSWANISSHDARKWGFPPGFWLSKFSVECAYFLLWKNRAAEGGESSCHGTGKACTKTSYHLLCMVSVAISAADWMQCMVYVVEGTTSLVLHSGSVVLAWNFNTSGLTHSVSLYYWCQTSYPLKCLPILSTVCLYLCLYLWLTLYITITLSLSISLFSSLSQVHRRLQMVLYEAQTNP